MTDEENQERGGLGDRDDRNGVVLAGAQDCGAAQVMPLRDRLLSRKGSGD